MEDLFYRVEHRNGDKSLPVDMCYARSEEEARLYISWLTKNEKTSSKPYCLYLWQEGFGYDVDSILVTQFDHFGIEIPRKLQDLGWEYDSNLHPRLLTEEDEHCDICKEVKLREIKAWEAKYE